MTDIYSIVLLIMELAVVFCCFLVSKKKKEYSKPLLHLLYAGMGTVLFYTGGVMMLALGILHVIRRRRLAN